MPFELGLDVGCREYGRGAHAGKVILILEEEPYRYQAALSDIAGFDIQNHDSDHQTAVRNVRNWIANEAGLRDRGAGLILRHYADFQGWHYRDQLRRGFSEDDIRDYPTAELLDAMKRWTVLGRPLVP